MGLFAFLWPGIFQDFPDTQSPGYGALGVVPSVPPVLCPFHPVPLLPPALLQRPEAPLLSCLSPRMWLHGDLLDLLKVPAALSGWAPGACPELRGPGEGVPLLRVYVHNPLVGGY